MTLPEITEAIGVPPGYYDSLGPMPPSMSRLVACVRETGLPEEALPDAAGRPGKGYTGKLTVERWIWDDYCIWVTFDEYGRSKGHYLLEVYGSKATGWRAWSRQNLGL